MSTLINLPVLCASISLPKKLKSGKRSAEIIEWISKTNGSLVVVSFVTCKKWCRSGISHIATMSGHRYDGRNRFRSPTGCSKGTQYQESWQKSLSTCFVFYRTNPRISAGKASHGRNHQRQRDCGIHCQDQRVPSRLRSTGADSGRCRISELGKRLSMHPKRFQFYHCK
jgi:hypothetical protein